MDDIFDIQRQLRADPRNQFLIISLARELKKIGRLDLFVPYYSRLSDEVIYHVFSGDDIYLLDKALEKERDITAEQEFEEHQFIYMINDVGGWTRLDNKYTLTVFFEDPDDPDGDSMLGDFTVIFYPKSTRVRESYG